MSNHTEDGSFAVFGDKLMTKAKKKANRCLFTTNPRKKTKS